MTDTTAARTAWIDGDPLMETIAAAIWEHCDTEGTSIVRDDPRNIAAVVAAVVAQSEPAVRAAAFDEAADKLAGLDPAKAALAGQLGWQTAAGVVRHMGVQERRMANGEQPPAEEPPARHTADSITDDELDALYAELARLRDAAESMAARPPNGLNPDRAPNESPKPENGAQTGARGAAVLTVVVTAPTQENAEQWAATLRDLITAEHGDEMRLHMTINPGDGRGQDTAFPAANRPGSTAEQLPDHILNLIRPELPNYLSTACSTGQLLAAAIPEHPAHADELDIWLRCMHKRCRLNMKFTGQLCCCDCHTSKETQ